MRVVFLTHNYPRTSGDVSGAFLETLAVALVARGVDVRVIAPSELGQGGEEERNKVCIRRVRYAEARRETIAYRGTMAGAVRRPGSALAAYGLWRALRHAAEEELQAGADLIHAHWWVPAGLAAPPRARFVLTCHGTDVALLGRSPLARTLARPTFRRARVVTAVSTELARVIARATGRTVRADHIQPMPVDVTGFRPGAGGGGAIFIGRLTSQKRVELAIGAVARLRAMGRELPLTIVGDGPERAALERTALASGASGLVSFEGEVPPSEIPRWLARSDVMLFPARREGFGLVAAEALMSGVPVVACEDGGGVLDVVPETGAGRRCPPVAAALAEAAAALLERDARSAALAQGEIWRRRLAPASVAEACEHWYTEALGG